MWDVVWLPQITSFLVFEEAPPILLICIGLETGCIYGIRGDVARDRVSRLRLQVDAIVASPVTGLAFRVDGQVLQLFVVTPSSVNLFDMHKQPPVKHVLDSIGAESQCVTMSDNQVSKQLSLEFKQPKARESPCSRNLLNADEFPFACAIRTWY